MALLRGNTILESRSDEAIVESRARRPQARAHGKKP